MLDINRYRLPGFEKRFSRQRLDRALLVVLQAQGKSRSAAEESLKEMRELTSSAAIHVLEVVTGQVPNPSPKYFIREGKLTELTAAAKNFKANVLIFNVDLTPGQMGNIEAFTKVPVLDRTGLILEIFARRAQSREGKLQVELAQLHYALPRIGGLGVVMSRLGGGIGGRGPGEQELEHDRRKVRNRIRQVKLEIEKVQKHRELIRSGRRRKNFITAAIVGYTNAGKSTLLNALTAGGSYVADKMFATLDPVTRAESINNRSTVPGSREPGGSGSEILFIDTVGFLRDLPHGIVEAFHATLEEVAQADLLIHVLDVSSPQAREMKKDVEKVLQEIKADGKPVVLALNKADLLKEEEQSQAGIEWPDGILISAKEKLGFKGLLAKVETAVV